MWQERELQSVSAPSRLAFSCPVAVGDDQSAVLLRWGGAWGSSVSFVETSRVTAGLGGIVVMVIGQISCGEAAALDVRGVAVGVAVLVINVLTQFPPLPLF